MTVKAPVPIGNSLVFAVEMVVACVARIVGPAISQDRWMDVEDALPSKLVHA